MKTKTNLVSTRRSKILVFALVLCIMAGSLMFLANFSNSYADEPSVDTGRRLYYVDLGSDNGYSGNRTLNAVAASDVVLASPNGDNSNSTFNTFTEQLYAKDPVTGKLWGSKLNYLRGTTGNTTVAGYTTFRYPDTSGNGNSVEVQRLKMSYGFEVENASLLRMTLGFFSPWSTRSANVFVNGEKVSETAVELTQNTIVNRSYEVAAKLVDGKYMIDLDVCAAANADPVLTLIIIETLDCKTMLYGGLVNKQILKVSSTTAQAAITYTDGSVVEGEIPLDNNARADMASKAAVGVVIPVTGANPAAQYNANGYHTISTVYEGSVLSGGVYVFPDEATYFVNVASVREGEPAMFGSMYPNALNVTGGVLAADGLYNKDKGWGRFADSYLYGGGTDIWSINSMENPTYRFDLPVGKYDVYWGATSATWWTRCSVVDIFDVDGDKGEETKNKIRTVEFLTQNTQTAFDTHVSAKGIEVTNDALQLEFAKSSTQHYNQSALVTYIIITPSKVDALDANGGMVIYTKPAYGSSLADAGYDALNKLPEPIRNGYTFGGWFSDSACTVAATLADLSSIDDSFRLYAKWTAGQFDVAFNANGGTGAMTAQSFTVGTQAALKANSFTRDGYTFAGWATSPKGAKVYDDEADFTLNSAGATLYAVWLGAEVDVEIIVGDATLTTATTNYNSFIKGLQNITGEQLPEGKIFGGWWTTDGDDGVTFVKEYRNNMLVDFDSDIKLFARFYNASAEFELVYNDGVTQNGTTTVIYNQNVSGLPDSPTRTNYDFDGWYTDQNGQGFRVFPTSGTNYRFRYSDLFLNPGEWAAFVAGGDLKLYASWKGKTFGIEYHVNGGFNPVDVPVEYVYSVGVALPTPSLDGYNFTGWFENEELTGDPVFTIGTSVAGDKIYWAGWELIEYSIAYETNGGSFATTPASTYTIVDTVTLAEPTRSGYTFAGWFTDEAFAAGSEISELGGEGSANVIIYAKWTANSYTITLDYQQGTANAEDLSGECAVIFDAAVEGLLDPTRVSHIFKGWYTEANGGGTKIENGDIWTISDDITIYAFWEISSFTVTFNRLGGTGDIAAQVINAGGKATKPATDPARSGYTFEGWYKESECTNKWNFETDTVSGNITLFAKWLKVEDTEPAPPPKGCGSTAYGSIAMVSVLSLLLAAAFIAKRKRIDA